MLDPILQTLQSLAARDGLACRGVFHPEAADGAPEDAVTLVLLGWTGRGGWEAFAASPERADGAPHPLDRWSRRIVDALGQAVGAVPVYPFGGPPYLPFQRWAARAEPVHPSPLGLFIHPDWGLWHSYRGGLAFTRRLESVSPPPRPNPCATCIDRPCLAACPVGAFTVAGYDVAACAAHVGEPAGAPCREDGCLARRSCPVGRDHAYGPEQAQFHMRAFLAAR